jgi:hypothetical protein
VAVSATLDHLVYAVPNLPAAVADFAARSGIAPAVGGRHVGRGTANYLVGLGDSAYLEIIGPDPHVDDRTLRLPFGIERLTAPALITWAVRTPDIDTAVAVARRAGYDPGDPSTMSRRTSSGSLLEWRLTADTIDDGGGVVPFLIDWGAGLHPATTGLPQLAFRGLRLASPQPEVVGRRLSAIGVQVTVDSAPAAALTAVLQTPLGELHLDGWDGLRSQDGRGSPSAQRRLLDVARCIEQGRDGRR